DLSRSPPAVRREEHLAHRSVEGHLPLAPVQLGAAAAGDLDDDADRAPAVRELPGSGEDLPQRLLVLPAQLAWPGDPVAAAQVLVMDEELAVVEDPLQPLAPSRRVPPRRPATYLV